MLNCYDESILLVYIYFVFFVCLPRNSKEIETLGSLIDIFCQVFCDLKLKNKLGFC